MQNLDTTLLHEDKVRILELTEALMALRTDPGAEVALNAALDLVIAELEGLTVEVFECEGIRSILCYRGASRPKRFRLILNGHLDVIPGKVEQYKAVIDGDRLFGVGSMDMKSNVATMLFAFKKIVHQVSYPIGFQVVLDEEIGGHKGTLYQKKQGVLADFAIAGESTGFNIANQARGILQAVVKSRGVTAHGAYPWRGRNAVESLIAYLRELTLRHPNPDEQSWKSSINIAHVSTPNDSFNKIPDEASAKLDIRFVPEDEDALLASIQGLLTSGMSLKIIHHEPALDTSESNSFVQSLKRTAEELLGKQVQCYGAMGTSDARFFSGDGCGVEFGPVGGGIGSDDEWVSISSLEDFYRILLAYARRLEDLPV